MVHMAIKEWNMRYLLENRQKDEIVERAKFLYDVFKLYMLNKREDEGFRVLESLPSNALDIFIIIGHDKTVYSYLKKNMDKIHEINVIVISCNTDEIKKIQFKDKNIFVSKNIKGSTECRTGIDYGFGFPITDSELDLYNSKNKDIFSTIELAFLKL